MHDIKGFRTPRERMRATALLRLFRLYAVALGLIVLAGVSTLAAWRMYGRMARASEGETAAKAQLAMAEQQKARVTADLERLSTPTGVEGELRQRYGVAKPGEGVIQVVPEGTPSSTPDQVSSDGLWSRMWHALFP